jgi:hypothetical protein
MAAAHHRANVLFNIMRGGVFVDGTMLDRDDLLAFARSATAGSARAGRNLAAALAGRAWRVRRRWPCPRAPAARRPSAWCWSTCR